VRSPTEDRHQGLPLLPPAHSRAWAGDASVDVSRPDLWCDAMDKWS
jgi:hypothetical protein